MSIRLGGGTLALAIRLQEAMDSGDALSSNDIRTRLQDAINDKYRGTGNWCYLIDSFGDAESGDVIYSCSGETYRAGYEMSGGAGAQKCIIDFDGAEDVVPRMVYETEADEGEHIASMESLKAEKLYGDTIPLYERFISKSKREKMDPADFAGKGKSFPIETQQDFDAALHSIGRAGSENYGPSKLRANILAIGKRKGFRLPKSAQSDSSDSKEAAAVSSSGLRLVESASTMEPILLREARADYEIKLIAPGMGSSAFYPAEVLKRDGPKVFKGGTHVYLNHATAAEEAARPEGDVKNLAGVLTTDAIYSESHAKGPGLYARMKVFADHASMVEEKAQHVGMSIRASGVAEAGKVREGKPVLKELTGAESVDVVTRAGAGGLILTEAARAATPTQEASMDADELKLLRESVARLSGKEMRREAIQEGARILRDVSLPDAAKEYVIETVLKEALPTKDGALDIVKFTEAVNGEAKRFGSAIGMEPRVTGMGAGAPVQITEAQRTEQAAAQKATDELYRESWATLLDEQPKDGKYRLAEAAMRGRIQ